MYKVGDKVRLKSKLNIPDGNDLCNEWDKFWDNHYPNTVFTIDNIKSSSVTSRIDYNLCYPSGVRVMNAMDGSLYGNFYENEFDLVETNHFDEDLFQV